MFKETQKNLPVDVAIFSAAVADFKISKKSNKKIKKQDELIIRLEKNVDILNYISKTILFINYNLQLAILVSYVFFLTSW